MHEPDVRMAGHQPAQRAGNRFVFKQDLAAVGIFQPGNQPQQRGFAAAALSNQSQQFAFAQRKRDILHSRLRLCRVCFGYVPDC